MRIVDRQAGKRSELRRWSFLLELIFEATPDLLVGCCCFGAD